MKHFRIVEQNNSFFVQKKFLWWWVDQREALDSVRTDNSGDLGFHLTSVIRFDTHKQARAYIESQRPKYNPSKPVIVEIMSIE